MKCANFALIFLSILTFTTAVPVYEAQYKGIFGKLCSSITKRFEKFGKCISQTSEFQRLNSTFWFQAAKQELCGTSSQAVFVKSTTLNNSEVSVLQLKTNSGIVPINFDGNYQNDTALEYEAQYLYDLEKKNQATESKNPFNAASFKQAYGNNTGAGKVGFNPISWDLDGEFGESQCLNLCDIIRQGSNGVTQCWSAYSMAVLYGVCEIGCRFYL